MRRAGALLIAGCLLLSGCVSLHPELSGAPTPAPTPTPTPAPLLQELALPTPAVDAVGQRIVDAAAHYERYVSYRQMRVYEYELGTLLDGICINAYPEPLVGAVEIGFRDAEGTLLASAMLHTAEEANLLLRPGENRIYAEIDTDMDIQGIDFTLSITTQFEPAEEDGA